MTTAAPAMKRYFVTFYSPGTFVAEESTKQIESWDVEKAVEMARGIVERHAARPFGFRFSTRERTDADLDSSETDRSQMYYLGGTILTVQDVKDRNDPKDRTLIANMERNGWERVIQNNNSWQWVQPLRNGDVVLTFEI